MDSSAFPKSGRHKDLHGETRVGGSSFDWSWWRYELMMVCGTGVGKNVDLYGQDSADSFQDKLKHMASGG
jgi:hypothetical protein